MDGTDIYLRFIYLSKLVAGFDFVNYLTDNQKEFIIFKIDLASRQYIPLYGENIETIVAKVNTQFHDTKAGFVTDINNILFLATNTNADLLFLSDVIIDASEPETDTILIHEFAHFLIMSGNQDKIKIDENAKQLGERLYNITDIENVLKTKHLLEFCILLSQLSINYQNGTKAFKDDWEAVKSTMRYDIFPPCMVFSQAQP